MKTTRRTAIAVLTAGVLGISLVSASTSAAAPAAHPSSAPANTTHVYTLRPDPPNNGNPEGITWDPRTRSFYVGTTGDGTIYRGTLDDPTLRPFILGGGESDGVHEANGRLYVAGGGSDTIRVYDIASRRLVASFATPDPTGQGQPGFINDLVILRNGDVI